ncbi:MAG: hypothetical protein ACRDE2_06525, partial [Chitinophagaceae bacterium]
MRTLISIIALTLIFLSPAFSQLNNSTTEFNLKYQFNSGDQFQVNQHSQEDSYLDLNGVEQRTTNQIDAILMLTVTTVNPAQATLEATYKQINL